MSESVTEDTARSGTCHFSVSGAFLTGHARDLVREGTWERGLSFLVDHLEGMTYDVAIQILKGEQRLIGDTREPEGIRLDKEDPNDPDVADYLAGCAYVYKGRIRHGSRWYRPYALISGYGSEDAQYAMKGWCSGVSYLTPAIKFGEGQPNDGKLTTFRDVDPPLGRARDRWMLDRVAYYLDHPQDDRVAYMDVPASLRRMGDDTGLWGCVAVAFQVCDAPPVWTARDAARSPAEAVQALYDAGLGLERRGEFSREVPPLEERTKQAQSRLADAQAEEASLGKALIRPGKSNETLVDLTGQLTDAHQETQRAKRALRAERAFARWCEDHPELADRAKADPTAVIQDSPQTYREALAIRERLREYGRCGEIYADPRAKGSCIVCDREEGHNRERGHSALTRNAPYEGQAWEDRAARDWDALDKEERSDAQAVIDSGLLARRLERFRDEIQRKAGPQDGPGWIDLPVYPDHKSDTPDRVLRVPRDPFVCWSLWRTTGRHLMPNWVPVCPQGLKLMLDDVYHTDWLVGAGLELGACYGKEGEALNDSANRLMGDLQASLLQFEATVLSGGDQVVIGTAVHPKMGDTVSRNHIAILPDARPGWESVVRTAGATIVPVGGELCHLATVATEAMRVILRVPGCLDKYPPKTPLTVDAGAGKILIHNRSVRSLLGEDEPTGDP